MTPQYFPADSEFIKRDTRTGRWAIPYHPECLNARVKTLLTDNRDRLEGRRVLDLGSHIGTLSYAALQTGASFVLGLDTEPGKVDTARTLFDHYAVPQDLYRFEVAEGLDYLENAEPKSFDTLFCFGLLYYMPEPYRLLRAMVRAARECILLDTFTAPYAAVQGKDAASILPRVTDATWEVPLLLTTLTQAEKKDYTLPDAFHYRDRAVCLAAYPSVPLLELWFASLALKPRRLDWSPYQTRPCHWRDLITPEQKQAAHWADVYTAGLRVAYRLDLPA